MSVHVGPSLSPMHPAGSAVGDARMVWPGCGSVDAPLKRCLCHGADTPWPGRPYGLPSANDDGVRTPCPGRGTPHGDGHVPLHRHRRLDPHGRASRVRFGDLLDIHHRLLGEAVVSHRGVSSTRRVTPSSPCSPPPPSPRRGRGRPAGPGRRAVDGGVGTLRVRMGLHTGEAVLGGADYVGLAVHRAARLAAWPTAARSCCPRRPGAGPFRSCPPTPASATWASTGSRTCRARARSSSSCIPTCRPTSRPCARWTRCRTTCPCS